MGVVMADDGTRLHVEVHEPPQVQGPTVVLTHGWAQASTCWHHQVAHLVGLGHRVVTWDLRGHGRSDRGVAGSCTIDVVADDLARVLDAVAPGDVVLVGHSMGGMALMALAARHPHLVDRVCGIAFVSTAASSAHLAWLGLPPRATPGIQRLVGRSLARLAPWQPSARVQAWTAPGWEVALWLWCCGGLTRRDDVRRAVEAVHGGGFASLHAFLPSLLAHDCTDRLAAWRGRPALVLHGTADLLVPVRCADEIGAALPGTRCVHVRGAGHNVMVAAHRRVDAELAALVARAASSREVS